MAGLCGKAPHALRDMTPKLVRLLETILMEASFLHGMESVAKNAHFVQVLPIKKPQRLYRRQLAEPRPPKPTTNAISRILHMDWVMATQAKFEPGACCSWSTVPCGQSAAGKACP